MPLSQKPAHPGRTPRVPPHRSHTAPPAPARDHPTNCTVPPSLFYLLHMGPAINHVFKNPFTLEILIFLYFSKALLIYIYIFSFSKLFLIVHGAARGPSRRTCSLRSSARGLAPRPGIGPRPLRRAWGVLAAGPPGKRLFIFQLEYSCFTVPCWFLLQRRGSATCTHVSPSSWTAPALPSHPLGEHRAEPLCWTSVQPPSPSLLRAQVCSLHLCLWACPKPRLQSAHLSISTAAALQARLGSHGVPHHKRSTALSPLSPAALLAPGLPGVAWPSGPADTLLSQRRAGPGSARGIITWRFSCLTTSVREEASCCCSSEAPCTEWPGTTEV
ncbi:uncharacterized protein LOC121817483 [Ovis aries]|uniref:uncharacterized protein LOC121817483 n=1 Tax=Ovis aries TaxID=9940 RepID=UPI002952715C|nr:uncharacterized protein LOC121817483 [Ovis aries]XP_060260147.1 uncharacterized protein LOC121817483 [Ovis aries]